MAIQLTSQLSAIAQLFNQFPGAATPAAFNQDAAMIFDVSGLLLLPNQRTLVGIQPLAGTLTTMLTVPFGKVWIIFGTAGSAIVGAGPANVLGGAIVYHDENLNVYLSGANALSDMAALGVGQVMNFQGPMEPSPYHWLPAGHSVGFRRQIFAGAAISMNLTARVIELDRP